MYAIISDSGRQFTVREGDVLRVDYRDAEKGSAIDFDRVLAVSDDPTHTIATIGCRDLIVVHTRDVTMVCPVAEAQRVRALAEKADEDLR